MIHDFDQRVKLFTSEWELSDDSSGHIIRTALTGLLIPFIYKSIREELLSEKPIPLKDSQLLYKNIKNTFIHTWWYFLWIIKWILFISFIKKPTNIIITSFFKNSKVIHKQLGLFKYSDSGEYFINFSILYDLDLLFDSKFFCYPCAVFGTEKQPDSYNAEYANFTQLFKKHFQLEFIYTKQFKQYLNRLNKLDHSFRYLLFKLSSRHSCVCLLQDCDYLAERVLFTHICNTIKIPSIVFDHSIVFANHLFQDCCSKYALVWGDYSLERIKNYSNHKPDKIIITGKPLSKSSDHILRIKKKFWVYFLPAFQEAHIQSFYRRMDDTLLRIKELNIYLTDYNTILYIKPHPSDEINIFPFRKQLTTKNLVQLVQKCSLAFVEDSTISLELLQYNIPVMYIADNMDNDPLQIKGFGPDYMFCSTKEAISDKLKEVKTPDMNKRKSLIKYYFGEYNSRQFNFYDLTYHDKL